LSKDIKVSVVGEYSTMVLCVMNGD